MNDINTVEVTEVPVEENATAEGFKNEEGLAAAMHNLGIAQTLSAYLNSGLTTQAEIKRTAVELRNILLHIARATHKEYAGVIMKRTALLSNVGTIQVASKREQLLKKKADLEAQLAALG